jgi:hypothetical protein
MPNWKKLIVSGSSANLSNLNVDNAVTASYFKGDGSALTGVTSTVVETATVTSSFSNVSSVSITHNFGTKDVIVSTYLSDDTLFYPASITTTNTSSVDILFGSNRTGRVVVAKGGHVVQGSIVGDVDFSNLTNTPTLLSSSNQIATDISGSFTSLSGSIATRFDGLTSDYTELTNIPQGIVSSSTQLASDISGSTTSLSASIATRFDGLTSNYTELTNIPSGIISSSAQIDNLFDIDNIISSSNQIASDISGSFTATSSSLASRISNIIDGTTLVSSASYAISSSHEITFELSSSHAETADVAPFSGLTGLPTLVSGSQQINYTGITNVPSGIISSSTQFNALSDTSASYALTASYALNAGGGSGAGFPFSGSAVITGSLYVSGSTISGSFAGDGSGITGITISEFATVEDTFTNAPSHSVVHNFGTKNVFVQVFEDDDTLLIPFSVTTTTVNQVDIVFGDTLSGRVVIGKAGHIISGSLSNAISSSYATTASYIQASGVDGTVANATTASFAVTASYAENAGGGNVTGSFTNVTSSVVTHNFGTKAVIVQVYDTNDFVMNPSSIQANTENQVTVTFSTPESGIIVVGS